MLGHPIALASQPGRGSVFSVRVPRAADGQLAAPAVREPAPGAVAGQHVLCVDNDPSILEGMRALLQRWGLSVDTATGLEPALLAARARRPDILLVDLHLGESLDGLAVIEILRRALAPQPPPAALVTAESGDELQRRCREAGYPLLGKPVRPAALRALIAALAKRRAQPLTPDPALIDDSER